MLTINWKQVYEINGTWILILYDISKNHYVGLPIYKEEKKDSMYLSSIKRYIILKEITDYSRTSINRCIYEKGKPLKISSKEYDSIMIHTKDYFLNYIKENTDNTPDGIAYNKWCKDKLQLNNGVKNVTYNLKIGAICWVDLGYNVGNELRKLRPAILWRSSSDKKMWTVIPLTTKRKNDNYYFHYDLDNKALGTARIENLINISVKRIKEPYFSRNKISTISEKDNDELLKIIKKYYAFEDTVSSSKKVNKANSSKRQNEPKIVNNE